MMTHVDLQAAAVQLLGYTGWGHLHVRRSIGKGHRWQTTTNVPGWPDLWCWAPRQPGRWLAVEVKVLPDWLSDDQYVLLASLAAAGAEVLVLVERHPPKPPTGVVWPCPHPVVDLDQFAALLRRR